MTLIAHTALRLLSIATIVLNVPVGAAEANLKGDSFNPSTVIASDSALAACNGFVYAVADDRKHLLRKSLSSGAWVPFPVAVEFLEIGGLTAQTYSASTSAGLPAAPNSGAIYLADAGSNSIYKVDVGSSEAELLYQGDAISTPGELSVEANGLFISTLQNAVFVLDLQKRALTPLNLGDPLPHYGRVHLAADGGVLLVSNPAAGVLFSITNPLLAKQVVRNDYFCQGSSSSCTLNRAPKGLGHGLQAVLQPIDKVNALQHPGPIAVSAGVIYTIDATSNQVFASSQYTLRPIRLYSWDHKVRTPSSILLTRENIILLDAASRDIVIWPLLTPAEIVVDVRTSESLSAIYNYLYVHGLLPTRTTSLSSSIEKTLRDQGSLFSPYVTSLDAVMCGLNHDICTEGTIKQNLEPGTTLTIPDLYSEDYIDLRQVTLDGTHSLDYVLDHGLRSESFKAWKSESKLRQLNPQYRGNALQPIKLKRHGTYTVPVELVRYLVAFPQDDLASKTSKLAQIKSRYADDLSIYSLREVRTTLQQDPTIKQYLVALNEESFRSAYATLKQTIHFRHPDALPSHPTSYIGVAEELIDCDNPDFTDVCSQPVNEVSTTPQSIVVTAAPAVTTFRTFQKTDHGTAVAGLLAARHTGYTATGLVSPEGFVIPLISKEPPLADEIKSAVSQNGAQVFNLSFAFDDGPPPEKIADEVTLGTPDTLANAIFVVAAPDDGKPVCHGRLSYPICWANQANVLGVAATLLDGSELIPSDQGPAWGKDYVQVAAPGIGFGAPGLNGNYVPVAGTSFAAPLVSATAALLIEQGVTNPTLIKQRIIATATEKAAYKDQVKGGLLNVDRAVSHVAEGVLVDGTGNEKVVQLVKGGKITFTSSKGSFTVDLQNVLRLTQKDDSYRIIFQLKEDPSQLEVWDHVSFVEGMRWKIKYRISSAPPLGPIVADDLANYADYFGPILN